MKYKQLKSAEFLSLLGMNSKDDGFTLMLNKSDYIKVADLTPQQADALQNDKRAHISLHDSGSKKLSKDSIVRSRVFMYMDIDTKDEGVYKKNIDLLASHNLLPSVITHTNSGYHFIWLATSDMKDIDVTLMNTIAYRMKKILIQIDRCAYVSYTRYCNNFYTSYLITSDEDKPNLYTYAEFYEYVVRALKKNKLDLSTYIDERKVTLDVFERTSEYCKVLQNIFKDGREYSYDEWKIVGLFFANLHVLFLDEEGKENPLYRQRFLQTVSSQHNYEEGKSSKNFSSLVEMVKDANGVVFYSCKTMSKKDEIICKSCKYPCKGMSYNKTAKPTKIVTELDNYMIEDGNLFYVQYSKDEIFSEELCKAFSIEDVYNVINDGSLLKQVVTIIVDKGEQGTIRYRDEINKEKNVPNDLMTLVEAVGDRKPIDNYYKLMRKDIEAKNLPSYVGVSATEHNIIGVNVEKRFLKKVYHSHSPVAEGDREIFFNTTTEFLLDPKIDVLSKFAMGFSMLAIAAVNDSYSYMLSDLNPMMLFSGKTATGKTTRVRIANALWRAPNQIMTFASQTAASIQNRVSMVQGMLYFDELIMSSDNAKQVTDLMYVIANRNGKDTFNEHYQPIRGSVFFTGEVHNNKGWKNSGLNRRIIKVMINKKKLMSATQRINEYYLPIFTVHFGHIYELNAFVNNNATYFKAQYKELSKVWHIPGLEANQNGYVVTSLLLLKMYLLYCNASEGFAHNYIQSLFNELTPILKVDAEDRITSEAGAVYSSLTKVAEFSKDSKTIANYRFSELKEQVIFDVSETASQTAVQIMVSTPQSAGTSVKYNCNLRGNPLIEVMAWNNYQLGLSDSELSKHYVEWSKFLHKDTVSHKYKDLDTWEMVAENLTSILSNKGAYTHIANRDTLGYSILANCGFPPELDEFFKRNI